MITTVVTAPELEVKGDIITTVVTAPELDVKGVFEDENDDREMAVVTA